MKLIFLQIHCQLNKRVKFNYFLADITVSRKVLRIFFRNCDLFFGFWWPFIIILHIFYVSYAYL